MISVILPAFNPGRFLAEAIGSVLRQTFADWEAIVVDDGSIEDLLWVASIDPRVALVRQLNQGLSAARNAGILASRGELIAFLDADDVWEPHKLARQVAALRERPDAVLAHSQMRFIDEAGGSGGLGWGGGYATYGDLLDGCGVCVSSVLIRRDVLFRCGLFDPLLTTAQDYDLWLKATRYGPMIADPEPLVRYRWHENNMSHDYARSYREAMFVLGRHLQAAKRAGDAEVVRRCRRGMRRTRQNLATQAVGRLAQDVKHGQLKSAVGHFGTAARISPTGVVEELASRFLRRSAARSA